MEKTLWTYTFGCKVNQFDTSQMELDVSQDSRWRINDKTKEPNAVLINTCTVTESADKQARQLVRRIQRKHPEAKVVVTGCYAQSRPQDFENLGVTSIIPMKEQAKLGESLDLDKNHAKEMKELPTVFRRTRAFLKMQDGCNAYCSFCILPYVRGRSRSIELEKIIELAQSYETHHYSELIVTGTHIGTYGRDLNPRMKLAEALQQMLDETESINMRISSLEPTTLTPDIIRLSRNNERIMPHFHIPMQSGCDSVLRRMNRKNTVENYVSRVTKLSESKPNMGLGADVIVGFCGETDSEFEQTRSVVAQLPFTYLHVFPYSPRPDTKASGFEDTVPVEEKKRRVHVLRQIAKQKSKAFCEKHQGRTVPVLLEKKRDEDGKITGHTHNYIRVKVDGPDRLMEMQVDVKLADLFENNSGDSFGMYGEVV